MVRVAHSDQQGRLVVTSPGWLMDVLAESHVAIGLTADGKGPASREDTVSEVCMLCGKLWPCPLAGQVDPSVLTSESGPVLVADMLEGLLGQRSNRSTLQS